jgi:hypothetical protein
MFLSNPASMNREADGHFSFNHQIYYAGVDQSSASFVKDFGRPGLWGLGFQRMDYGTINSYDQAGYNLGETDAGESAIVLGNAHKIGVFTVGGNLKMAFSNIAGFRASALLTDLALLFDHPLKDLNASLLIKNMGFITQKYSPEDGSRVPFDVQLGISFKPEHMPFRFSFTSWRLAGGEEIYFNPDAVYQNEEPSLLDEIFSHLIIGTELILGKNVVLMGGYNHLRREELKVPGSAFGTGLSFGLNIRIKSVSFGYAGSSYHTSGLAHHLGIAGNLSGLYKKNN